MVLNIVSHLLNPTVCMQASEHSGCVVGPISSGHTDHINQVSFTLVPALLSAQIS